MAAPEDFQPIAVTRWVFSWVAPEGPIATAYGGAPSISAVTGCSRQGAGTRHRLLRVRHVVQISQSAARSRVKTHPCFGLMIFARAGGCDRRLRTGGGMRAVRSAGLGAALILAAPVAATGADLAALPGPIAPAPLWPLPGIYAGGHLAGGFAGDTWRSGTGLFTPFIGAGAGSGPLGGGQLGANYQTGPWVLGFESAFSFADLSAETACARALYNCTIGIDGIGTQIGRASYRESVELEDGVL